MFGQVFAGVLNFAQSVTSVFNPASAQARSIQHLFVLTGIIMGLIFLVVSGWIVFILFRFRARPGEGDPDPVYGNKKLEITWTLIPAGIVVVFTVLMIRCMGESHAAVAADRKPDVVVTGHQWWWEIHYPNGLTTANEVHVPVGRATLVGLLTADVIHDFWVPQLGPMQDMIPNQKNYVWLEPSAPGVYDGSCAEFCGNDHGWMRIRVVAQPQAEFDAWESAQLRTASVVGADARAGQQLYVRDACMNCHATPGIPVNGVEIAPDLTNLADRQTLAAGTLPNSVENLARWLKHPQEIKPQCNMPDFQLSDAEVRALTAYLWRSASHER